jgi:hypothetical protein
MTTNDAVSWSGRTNQENADYTGPERSFTIITDETTIAVHDGATKGGRKLAKAGDNTDITALNGLTTPLSITSGGTGSASAPMIGVVTAADAPAARDILGLGTAAVASRDDFATALQGVHADDALAEVTGHIGAGGTEQHPAATTETAGFLSTDDKAKLDVLSFPVPVEIGGTGSVSAPMIGVVTAADAEAARKVLELGTAATAPREDFATAAQGAHADDALDKVTKHIGAGGTGQHPAATADTAGFLSAEDKVKLDVLSFPVSVKNGGTGSASAPMIGIVTAADAPAARKVLGLGTAAVASSSDFATAAQGAHADEALAKVTNHVGFGGTNQHPVATAELAGFMSAADKVKLGQMDLKAPLASPAFTGTPTGPSPARFDRSAQLVPASWVGGELGNYAGLVGYTVPTALTADAFGKVVVIGSLTGFTVTLPSSVTCPFSGGTIRLVNAGGTAAIVVTCTGNDEIWLNEHGPITSFTLEPGESMELVTVGPTQARWYAVGGSKLGYYATTSLASLKQNGFQRLPSGQLRVWGRATAVAAPTGVSFAHPFTEVHNISLTPCILDESGIPLTPSGNTNAPLSAVVNSLNKTDFSFTLWNGSAPSTNGGLGVCFEAIGTYTS